MDGSSLTAADALALAVLPGVHAGQPIPLLRGLRTAARCP